MSSNLWTAAALAAAALVAAGCSHLHARAQGFASDATRVQVLSTQIGGKNVFLPSTIAVAAGVPTVLSLYNTTDAPTASRSRPWASARSCRSARSSRSSSRRWKVRVCSACAAICTRHTAPGHCS